MPETERPKVYRTARIWLAIYAVDRRPRPSRSARWLPLVLIGGPRIYGTFMHLVYGLTQHAGHGRERARPPAQHPHGADEPASTGSSTGT